MIKIFDNWLLMNHFVYGTRCLLCRARTGDNADCCPHCWAELPWLGHACNKCAVHLPTDASTSICASCLQRSHFDRAVGAFAYEEPLRSLITGLKFRGRREYARPLAAGLVSRLIHTDAPTPDVLVPVPLHPAGYRRRGFNQAELLARLIARRRNITLNTRLLARVQNAPPQSTLSANRRRANVRGAFHCRGSVDRQRVAVVDDVVTTGATAAEIATELRRAGASHVDVYCAARATA